MKAFHVGGNQAGPETITQITQSTGKMHPAFPTLLVSKKERENTRL